MGGLLLRSLLLFFFWESPLTIVDETHYQAIAENLHEHQQFALHENKPTAIRPPAYPFFLFAVYSLVGGVSLNAVRIIQVLLSGLMIVLTYKIGEALFDRRVGWFAAGIMAVYPSFLFFTHLLLTEVLFTVILLFFVWTVVRLYDVKPENGSSTKQVLTYGLLAGASLGAGALTRSILYPFLIPFLLFLIISLRNLSISKRVATCAAIFICYALVIAPWAMRNYSLYQDFVPVATMGGLNLYMGNYEHTPLNRAWAAVDLTGDKTWYHGHEAELRDLNEAQKQKWAMGQAKAFMMENKGLTLKRTLIKAANFWGLERSIIAGILHDHWPRLSSMWILIFLTAAVFFVYGFVVLTAVIGIGFNINLHRWSVVFILVLLLYFTGLHALVFGHSRYHLPLIPLLSVFAGWTCLNRRSVWGARHRVSVKASLAVGVVFILIWLREIILVEGERFLKLLA